MCLLAFGGRLKQFCQQLLLWPGTHKYRYTQASIKLELWILKLQMSHMPIWHIFFPPPRTNSQAPKMMHTITTKEKKLHFKSFLLKGDNHVVISKTGGEGGRTLNKVKMNKAWIHWSMTSPSSPPAPILLWYFEEMCFSWPFFLKWGPLFLTLAHRRCKNPFNLWLRLKGILYLLYP